MARDDDLFGSVVSGTLRPEDLIPALMDELEVVAGDDPDARALLDEIEEAQEDDDYWDDEPDEDVGRLIDALNEHAPEGAYFGTHPGDGADFGWWPVGD